MRVRILLLLCALGLVVIGAIHHARPLPAAADDPTTHLYLPHVSGEACGLFHDPFDHPDNGWFVGQDGGLTAAVTGGEYRLAFEGYGAVWLIPSPVCPRTNYRAAVDARWAGPPGNFIGLLFAIDDPSQRAYLFAVNTDERVWLVFEVGPGSLAPVVAPTPHDAVLPGGAVNRLAAERRGDAISLSINGVPVGQLPNPRPAAPVLAGVAAAAYTTQPAADARFDNFSYSDE